MPNSKAEALTQGELSAKALIPSLTTIQKALRELLGEERIERIGKGVNANPYRYFLAATNAGSSSGVLAEPLLL